MITLIQPHINPMPITFHNDGTAYRLLHKTIVRGWIERVIKDEGFEAGDIAFVFCSPAKHLDINRTYLGHDYPTDVITFDYTEPPVVGGDIFIDPRTVADNARLFGVTSRDEMLRVLVHGVLHLCGHNDKTVAQQQAMRSLEDKYLIIFRSLQGMGTGELS